MSALALGPVETALLVVVIVTAMGAVVALSLLDRREVASRRVARVLGGAAEHGPPPPRRSVHADWLRAIVHAIGAAVGASPLVGAGEARKIRARLAAAGLRTRSATVAFMAVKAVMLVVVPALAPAVLGLGDLWPSDMMLKALVVFVTALLGWRLPDFIVSHRAQRRRQTIEDGLPDALDLLVICAESGLGLEAALDRVARELALANPALSAELTQTVAEMKVLPSRRGALDNLATRTGLATVRSVVGTLSQTLQYGTPLAQSLRVIAREMRTHRMLRLEARAARLPVLLTVPLVLFILPALFLIVAGPAALQILALMKS